MRPTRTFPVGVLVIVLAAVGCERKPPVDAEESASEPSPATPCARVDLAPHPIYRDCERGFSISLPPAVEGLPDAVYRLDEAAFVVRSFEPGGGFVALGTPDGDERSVPALESWASSRLVGVKRKKASTGVEPSCVFRRQQDGRRYEGGAEYLDVGGHTLVLCYEMPGDLADELKCRMREIRASIVAGASADPPAVPSLDGLRKRCVPARPPTPQSKWRRGTIMPLTPHDGITETSPVFSQPLEDSPVVEELVKGTEVEFQELETGFAEVRRDGKTIGYVRRSDIELRP